jgi:hypothetical protein
MLPAVQSNIMPPFLLSISLKEMGWGLQANGSRRREEPLLRSALQTVSRRSTSDNTKLLLAALGVILV